MTRAELREAAEEEWLRERLGQDVRQLVLRLDLVEMNVTVLYRLMRAVYPEVDVTGPVTAADHVVGPLDAPGVVLTDWCRAAHGCQQLRAQASKVNHLGRRRRHRHILRFRRRERGCRLALGAPSYRRAVEQRHRPSRGARRLPVRVREAREGVDTWLAPLVRKPE